MDTTFDLAARGGTIVERSGREPVAGDVAVTGDRLSPSLAPAIAK
jgi:hypothetical protein